MHFEGARKPGDSCRRLGGFRYGWMDQKDGQGIEPLTHHKSLLMTSYEVANQNGSRHFCFSKSARASKGL
jgi:hypothetical protein